VTRNRLRRRLRVAVQTAARAGLPGGCYLVQTQPPAATLDFETLSRYVAEVLQRAGAAGRDRRPTTTTPAP
jgi:ribonuclease P protein component